MYTKSKPQLSIHPHLGDHLPQHNAEGEDIGGQAEDGFLHGLRWHVADGPMDACLDLPIQRQDLRTHTCVAESQIARPEQQFPNFSAGVALDRWPSKNNLTTATGGPAPARITHQ